VPHCHTKTIENLDLKRARHAMRVYRPRAAPRAWAYGHCGELVQGPVADAGGGIEVGLVSLRANLYRACAEFRPDGSGRLRVLPETKAKALAAAGLLLDHLGVGLSGTLTIRNPAPEGIGFGTSTMDVTAAMSCVRNVIGAQVDPGILGRIAVAAEAASDPLMFPEQGAAVLWGPRCGKLLETFPGPVPRAMYVAVNAGLGGETVDTCRLARGQRFTEADVDPFRLALARLRHAIAHQDVRALGEASTFSAALNQKQLNLPRFDAYLDHGRQAGSSGLAISHSGYLVAFLYEPADPDLEVKVNELIQRLGGLGHREVYAFQSPNHPEERGHAVHHWDFLPREPDAVDPAPG
jgi:uncharacterized protein involved in propanediol utilization